MFEKIINSVIKNIFVIQRDFYENFYGNMLNPTYGINHTNSIKSSIENFTSDLNKSKIGARRIKDVINSIKSGNENLDNHVNALLNVLELANNEQKFLEDTIGALESLLEYSRKQTIERNRELEARKAVLDLATEEMRELDKKIAAFESVFELSEKEKKNRDKVITILDRQQKELNKKIQELLTLKSISETVNSTVDIDKVLDAVFNKFIELFGFDKILFQLVDAKNNVARVYKVTKTKKTGKYKKSPVIDIKIEAQEHAFYMQVISNGNVNDKTEKIASPEPIYAGSEIFYPVVSQSKVIGVFQLKTGGQTGAFEEYNKKFLANIIALITPALKNALLVSELEQTSKELIKKDEIITEDLILAKRIQTSIISNDVNKKSSIDVAVYFSPLMQVGGDMYDIFEIKQGYFRVLLADATGHGIQGALATMLIKSEYDQIKKSDLSPGDLLHEFNNLFIKNFYKLSIFCTCFLIDFDIVNDKAYYSNGGHPPQILISNGEIHPLKTKGPMIGMIESAKFETKEFYIFKDTKTLLFSDGLFEEFSDKVDILGDKHLIDIVKKYINEPVEKIKKYVIRDFKKWKKATEPQDDITFICIEPKL